MSSGTTPESESDERIKQVLQNLGFTPSKITEISRNRLALATIGQIVDVDELTKKILSPQQANLIASLSISGGNLDTAKRSFIVENVLNSRIKTQTQLTEAVKFFKAGGAVDDVSGFQDACGAGIELSDDQIRSLVHNLLDAKADQLSTIRWNGLRQALSDLKGAPELRWANPMIVKKEIESYFTKAFGPKETQVKAKTKVEDAVPLRTVPVSTPANIFEEGFLANLHKPGDNPQQDPRLRREHLEATGGKVITRFPPEPNGFLDITEQLARHSKAITVNFGYARYHGGLCYLRYDDTNPSKEEQIYFDSILSSIRWLGQEPDKITYSSDYFHRLYDLAVELIRRDKAYVCQCSAEVIGALRGGKGKLETRAVCVHRDRPVQESLELFEQMRQGSQTLKDMGTTLRMKQDMDDPNPQMWDLVAYRFHSAPHPRTGNEWCIYPTYDFTHCLCDSFENITHSLCTLEFVASRQSYEWLCHALDIYTPRQYEFSRLSVAQTVLSKRWILRLIQGGYVDGWDDIRLYTLNALRRRGIPPEAIVSFVHATGVTTTMATTELAKFEECIRQYLDPRTPRLMMVLRPIKVTIENLPEDFVLMVQKPFHPKDQTMGANSVPFTRTIFIDSEDFRTTGSKDYLRLIPGGSVGLLYVPRPIHCVSFESDINTGDVVHILCRYEDSGPFVKPKAYIQWVAEHEPSQSPIHVAETRIAKPLFKSQGAPDEDIMKDVDPNSLDVIRGAVLEVGFWEMAKKTLNSARKEAQDRISSTPVNAGANAITEAQLIGPECVRFQGLRTGYFALDNKDSITPQLDDQAGANSIFLNQIVSLKEDNRKNTK